jgi:hypothetical protein
MRELLVSKRNPHRSERSPNILRIGQARPIRTAQADGNHGHPMCNT